MADTVKTPVTEPVLEEPIEIPNDDTSVKSPEEPAEEPEADEPGEEPGEPENKDEEPEEDDMVSKAMAENEALKKQLEELKNANTNVFEQNEILKAELENQEKLVKVAKENEDLQRQLETIKRNSLIDSLIAQGSITQELKEWAESLDFENLQVFAKHAPKRKSILDQKNSEASEPDKQMEEWKKEQSKSRIIS